MDAKKSYDKSEQVEWLEDRRPFQRFMKRAMDIVGSILAIVFFSPLFLLMAAAISSLRIM